jgi:hypothetical protein
MVLARRADDGGQQARRTRESTKQLLKPSRREGRDVSAEPVVPAPCILFARGPWERRAPGLPCALSIFKRDTPIACLGRYAPREGEGVSLGSVFLCRRWQGGFLLVVIAREGGRSSTPRLLDDARLSLEYWIARSRLRLRRGHFLAGRAEALAKAASRAMTAICSEAALFAT